ncbi:M23 family metallopeptidase [Streptomyces abikoensis]|uniref:M23 family metallopeptidase n=1 Tax=Streptomyces abikoensis TaxID=97398 RepID=A0ABW7T365_9ACTN
MRRTDSSVFPASPSPSRRRAAAGRALTLCALTALIMLLACAAAVSGPAPPSPGPPRESGGPAGDRSWPVTGARGARPLVLRAWEPPPARWAAGHRGVDLAAGPGLPVRAAIPGRISFAGRIAGRGVVAVELAPALRTTYEPVRATVREGDHVGAGQIIGLLEAGSAHCPGHGCLHWGLRRGDDYLDPLTLLPPWILRRAPSRLWPPEGTLGPPWAA